MIGRRDFLILDVFARAKFQGNQLAVFPEASGLTDDEMQSLAREMHFSETTFIVGDRPTDRGYRARIFTPAREVPFAGHPTLGTAYVLWDRLMDRKGDQVLLDLKVGSVPVAVEENGDRLVMTQVPPEFGDTVDPGVAADLLGLRQVDVDERFPSQEVSTGLWFLIVPIRTLTAVQAIKVNLSVYYRLIEKLQAKAVLVFCPQTVASDADLHVRVFCDYYDVPEDPATGSANGCLCGWLMRHRCKDEETVRLRCEQGVEIQRPSLLHLAGTRRGEDLEVKVGGRVVMVGAGKIE